MIRRGGIVAYPTEAVYGLGCDPLNEAAVGRLLTLKQRPLAKGLILIAAEPEQLNAYIDFSTLNQAGKERVLASWPGPVTWLLPVRSGVPYWLYGQHSTLAVRVTAHPLAAELCRACGSALVSTSANLGGHPPARSLLQLRKQFNARLDYVLAGQLGGRSRPSEIRDAITGDIIRTG